MFKYRFGKKIFDKLAEKVSGSELDQPVNVFDLVEGCNFKLRVKSVKVEGMKKPQPNYDGSGWDIEKPIVSSAAERDAIIEQIHDLQYIVSEKNFKSYDELKKKLEWVLGAKESSAEEFDKQDQKPESTPTFDEDTPDALEAKTPETEKSPEVARKAPALNIMKDDDDDDADYFNKLKNL